MIGFSNPPPKISETARFTGSGSIANNIEITISYSGEDWKDSCYAHDNVTNNTRIYVKLAGKYRLTHRMRITSGTGVGLSTYAITTIYKKGVSVGHMADANINSFSTFDVYAEISLILAAGDYLEVFQYQNGVGTKTWLFELIIEKIG